MNKFKYLIDNDSSLKVMPKAIYIDQVHLRLVFGITSIVEVQNSFASSIEAARSNHTLKKNNSLNWS